MEERIITEAMLLRYRAYLEEEEKSRNTIEKYMRDLRAFRSWLSDRPVSRQETAAYKERLKEIYTVRSINSMLSSVNSFFRYCGWTDCCVRQLRVQNQIFCPREKELSKEEYRKLVEAARRQKKERLEAALGRALERHGAQAVLFQRGGKAVPLPMGEIRYLESRNHGVIVHLRDGEQSFAMPLAEAERLLPAGAFQRCHKSYLVNLTWVERATHAGVLLKDSSRLPMSRTFYSDFQNAIVRRLNT